jgi:uncharacterized surface protein with fasciclin (FAS1) repeats
MGANQSTAVVQGVTTSNAALSNATMTTVTTAPQGVTVVQTDHVVGTASHQDGKTVAGHIAAEGDLRILNAALVKTGLDKVCSDIDEYTIFAPNDLAFEAFGREFRVNAQDLVNYQLLPDILKNHVVKGKITRAMIEAQPGSHLRLTTVNGSEFVLDKKNGVIDICWDSQIYKLNTPGATEYVVRGHLLPKEIIASNGVIHKINRVIA